jgi:hypothetical protein
LYNNILRFFHVILVLITWFAKWPTLAYLSFFFLSLLFFPNERKKRSLYNILYPFSYILVYSSSIRYHIVLLTSKFIFHQSLFSKRETILYRCFHLSYFDAYYFCHKKSLEYTCISHRLAKEANGFFCEFR